MQMTRPAFIGDAGRVEAAKLIDFQNEKEMEIVFVVRFYIPQYFLSILQHFKI